MLCYSERVVFTRNARPLYVVIELRRTVLCLSRPPKTVVFLATVIESFFKFIISWLKNV